MKYLRLVLPSLLLAALTASGCWLVSGQFTVSVEILPDPLTVAGPGSLVSAPVDLTKENAYNDHKENLKGIVDYAILGTFINNNGTTPLTIEVWMTPGLTNHPDEAALNADATRIRVWGPLSLGAGASVKVGWDDSAALFTKAGKTALLNEVLGDGSFTLYAKGTGSSYNFTLDNGVAVVVIDAGK